MTPWRQYTLIGTTHVPYEGDPDEFAITEEDIQELLQEYNLAYPARSIRREDVTHAYGGLLPMEPKSRAGNHVTLTKHYKLLDHEKEHGLKGLVTVVGVKYTTARDVAARAVDIAVQKLGRRERCRTDQIPIPGGNIERFGAFLQEEITKRPWNLNDPEVRHLVLNYGREYPKILHYLEENVAWRERVDPEQEVLFAEVVHAIREEMAQTLLDVVRRRTELGSAGCPSDTVLEKVARLMASELGWDEAKIQKEIQSAKDHYRIAGYDPAARHVREPSAERDE
ncbi:MAG: glycerol-3-phosphate dehydrogenase C-terminal domain-containing protein [candidate division KSB1 bacterium]|nr:glycerol-3-phosphate dehydrogenase C-terminal domain-containing protein [candidate division KSB1 bacterium]